MSSDVSSHIRDKAETNAEAWFNIALRPWKPEGSLGLTAQDSLLDSHTAPANAFYNPFIYTAGMQGCRNALSQRIAQGR